MKPFASGRRESFVNNNLPFLFFLNIIRAEHPYLHMYMTKELYNKDIKSEKNVSIYKDKLHKFYFQ